MWFIRNREKIFIIHYSSLNNHFPYSVYRMYVWAVFTKITVLGTRVAERKGKGELKPSLSPLSGGLAPTFPQIDTVPNWSTIRKINFHKSIPLSPWVVHWSTPLLNPPWNWRRDCCLCRTMCFYYGRDTQFIFKISCSTQKTKWNLLLSQTLSRVVVGK